MRGPTLLRAAILFACLLGSEAACAQDLFELFGYGAEAKAHAGAGVLFSRGAPSLYTNPANLATGKAGLAPYAELDYARISYSYELKGFKPVTVDRSTPVPFVGPSYRFANGLAIGFNMMAIPAGAATMKVEGLPTKRLGAPVVVDVSSGSAKTSFRIAGGLAYRLGKLDLGLSVIHRRGDSETKVFAQGGDEPLLTDRRSGRSTSFLLGSRTHFFGRRLELGLSVRPPFRDQGDAETEIALGGEPSVKSRTDRLGRPLVLRGSAAFRPIRWLRGFVEFGREAWSSLKDESQDAGDGDVRPDYLDADTVAVGADVDFSGERFSAALSQRGSHLGDGVAADRSADGEARRGMEFQNLEGVPVTTVALGWSHAFESASTQVVISRASGSREVWEEAAGEGSYELEILQLGVGGTWRW